MSGPKHTPGPWRAMLDDSNPDEPRLAVMAGSRIVSETVIHGSDEASRQEAAANTRLEAAAPRLAEGLKELLDYTLALELVAYDTVEQRYKRPEVTAARATLREAGVES